MIVYKFTDFTKFNVQDLIHWVDDNQVILLVVKTIKLENQKVIERHVSQEQMNQKKHYYKEIDQNNYLISRAIINTIFANVLKIKEREVVWKYTEYKKPYISNAMGLKFNLSHTKGAVIIALAKNNIGVDIEYIDTKFDYLDIVMGYFSKQEKAKIDTVFAFYKHWVVKEAYLKYKGIGLLQDLSSVKVVDLKNHKAIIKDKEKKKIVYIMENHNQYVIAVCL